MIGVMPGRVDGSVYRGPRPESAAELFGIRTCLNLESGFYEFSHGAMYREDAMFQGGAIRELHVPLGDILPPTRTELDRCIYCMDAQVLQPVYVHCRWGKDRTGIVCAYYRVKVNGWPPDLALTEMYDLGFHRFPYGWWVPSLRRLLIRED